MPRADARQGHQQVARGRRAAVSLLVAFALVAGCSDEPQGLGPPTAAPTADTETPSTGPEGSPAESPAADELPGSVAVPEDPEPPPPVPETRAALTAQLDDVIAAAVREAPEMALGVLVVDEFGREVAAHEPDRSLLPASTLKQVTAAAVLTTLGADAQLRTVVDATAGVDGSGQLHGDLVVVGSGDPTLVTEEYARFIYPARPHTPLSALADQLVAAGLRRVTGDVRGVAPRFAPASLPTGWRDNYLSSLDGRYGAGLTVDGGLRTTIELPPPEEDEDTEDTEDAEEVEDAEEDPEPVPDGPPVSIFEQLADLESDLPPIVRVSLAEDPVLHTVVELTRLLRERGVIVDGDATATPPEAPVVGRLAAVASPPLLDVLRFTVQRSDNHLADALALVIARARTGEGSWTAADRAFGQVLARFAVPAEGAVFADGSGLSRDDRVTARLLTELDRRLTTDPRFGGDWRSLQAVAGRSGTLDRRLRGTPAEGRFLAKTGSLRDVAAISGQVLERDADPLGAAAPGDRTYHLAVLANDADGAARRVARALVDELVLGVIADLDGCRLAPAGDEEGPLGRPPSEVRCPAA